MNTKSNLVYITLLNKTKYINQNKERNTFHRIKKRRDDNI